MIGLDTNVLVRLFTQDNPEQTRAAKRFVAKHCTTDSPGYVNSVVLAEFVWVLRRHGYGRADRAAAVETLVHGSDRLVENHDEVMAALDDHKAGRADLVDALIARINRRHGCRATVTFDRKAARLDGFVAVP